MAGYSQPVIRIPFPDLTTDPQNDPVWVIIRNPKLMSPDELRSGVPGAYGQDGTVLDQAKAEQSSRLMTARIVVAARVYDPRVMPTFDPVSGEQTSDNAALLQPPPWDEGIVAALPAVIIRAIGDKVADALAPKSVPESGTPKTSSSPPNLSTTAPGDPVTSPAN